jgi:hypothetical protein
MYHNKKNLVSAFSLMFLTFSLFYAACGKKDNPEPAQKAVANITLNKTEMILGQDEAFTLTATVTPDNAVDKTVTWATSDAAIATITDGKIKCVAPGIVTITAKAGEKTATCKVTVAASLMTWNIGTPNAADVKAMLTGVTSGYTLTVVGNGAMQDWSSSNDVPYKSVKANIKTLIINNGVTNIGKEAFRDCSILNAVTIGNSVTSIGIYAFQDCKALSIFPPNFITSIGDAAFWNCTALTLMYMNSVTSIGSSAFAFCSALTAASIPQSATSIGGGAFSDCTGLLSVSIPASVTQIGVAPFSGCTKLTSVDVVATSANFVSDNGAWLNKAKTTIIQYPSGKTGTYSIPNSVTTIGQAAFAKCTGLTSVTIPNSVNSMAYGAFMSCSGLTSIICNAAIPPQTGGSVFSGVKTATCTLKVPGGSIAVYGIATEWKEFVNIGAI